MNEIIQLTSASFDEVVHTSGVPVLVDVWAPWCGPCRLIAPVIDEIAEESEGRFRVAKLNIDEAPEIAQRFKIRGVPALLYFCDGELRYQSLGVTSKRNIVHQLTELACATNSGDQ
jgi:thioredoxin 1